MGCDGLGKSKHEKCRGILENSETVYRSFYPGLHYETNDPYGSDDTSYTAATSILLP